MKLGKRYRRQGDLLIKRVNQVPTISLKTIVGAELARGEATGHTHQLVGNGRIQLYVVEGMSEPSYFAVQELEVPLAERLVHNEHSAIEIPEGTYEIIREREENPFKGIIQQVRD